MAGIGSPPVVTGYATPADSNLPADALYAETSGSSAVAYAEPNSTAQIYQEPDGGVAYATCA